MRFGLREEELQLILDVFRGIPEIEEVILFGSRAMGSFKDGSDIDLAVKGNGFDLRNAVSLRGKLEELPLPFTFDVIGFDGITNEALIEHIISQGKVLYRRKESIELVSDSGGNTYGEKTIG